MNRVTYLLPLLLLTSFPALAMRVATPHACPMFAKLCPDGSSVSPSGPNCEVPACPGGDAKPVQPMPPTEGSEELGANPGNAGGDQEGAAEGAAPHVAGSAQPRKSLLPDIRLDAPKEPQSVKFVVEHRTALNGQQLTVHGIVVEIIYAAACVNKAACMQSGVKIADTPDATRDKAYDTLVNLAPGEKTIYAPGQLVDIPAVAMGDHGNVFLQKK